MKRMRSLLCLITILLTAAADSTGDTVMRLKMSHRDTLFPASSHRIKDIIHEDQKRHNLISQKRKNKGGGAKLTLRSGFDYGAAQYLADVRVGTPSKRFKVVVDTGSELTWVNCMFRGKGRGKVKKRRVFRAEESSSFRQVGCLTQTCKVDLMNLFSLSNCPTPSTPCSYDYR